MDDDDVIDYRAFWNGTQYVVDGTHQWYSDDGSEWLLAPYIAAGGPLFERGRITLVGGPRNGDVVR